MATKPSPSAAPAGGSPAVGAGAIGDRRADEVGQPLQDVDAHRALAADAEAGGAVEALGDLRVDRDRGAAGGGEMRDLVEALLVEAAVLRAPRAGPRGVRGAGFSSAGR